MKYGLEQHGAGVAPFIDTRTNHLTDLLNNKEFRLSFEKAQAQGTLITGFSRNFSDAHLVFNFQPIKRIHDTILSKLAADALFLTFVALGNSARDKDENISIAATTARVDSRFNVDGRRGMNVKLTLPIEDRPMRAAFATQVMRESAGLLNYPRANAPPRLVNDDVFCSVSNETGITLTTSVLGSCSIDTDNEYSPADTTIDLWQHNIYAPAQQLILAAGAIALAYPFVSNKDPNYTVYSPKTAKDRNLSEAQRPLF